MKRIIDLRSDTVTKPSEGMRRAMYEAEVGDDVYGEDPTVNKLQDQCAELFGKEASLFVPSGVMGNQICINILTSPGDEIICDSESHIVNYESGSPSKLSGVLIKSIQGERGVMKPEDVEKSIRPIAAYYMPRTSLICLENTHNSGGGSVIDIENISSIKAIADKHNLSYHLDGARIWNAHTATGIPLKEYGKHFDTLTSCLSKGLGAPVGSIIAGSKEFIKEAIRVRKGFGGGMRQAGILAAAGLFALKNNLPLLKEDHRRCREITACLMGAEQFKVETGETNTIIFKGEESSAEEIIEIFKKGGILLSVVKAGYIRGVVHLDITDDDISYVNNFIKKEFYGRQILS